MGSGGSGSYILSGSGILEGSEIIGDESAGSFTQNGGTNEVSGGLTLGSELGSGSYTLNSGTLIVGTPSAPGNIVNEGGVSSLTIGVARSTSPAAPSR